VLRFLVNGQHHSSSYFVCNYQCHGLVQEGALAPATSGPAWVPPSPLPASPLCSTKEMRIAPVIEGTAIPQVTGVVRGSRSGPAPRGRACVHWGHRSSGGEEQRKPLPLFHWFWINALSSR
jgi:hypothetical protein